MTRVRPAGFEDLEAILAVSTRNGLSSFDPETVRDWWERHPYREAYEGIPIGWVLETAGGDVVGTFSNVHLMCSLDGRPVKAVVAGSWAVDPEYRNSSMLLAMAFLSQRGADVCLNGSASVAASRVFTAMRVSRIPSPDYDLSFLWVTDGTAFARAVFRKKGLQAPHVLGAIAGTWFNLRRLAHRKPDSPEFELKRLDAFGEAFDAFWGAVEGAGGKLRAVRNSEALSWRFHHELRSNRLVVLGYVRNETLYGYVVLRESTREHLGLRQYLIMDLQTLPGWEHLIANLIREAVRVGRGSVHAVEMQGWSNEKRAVAGQLGPYSYRYPVWPCFYKAMSSELRSALDSPDRWDASPFDAF